MNLTDAIKEAIDASSIHSLSDGDHVADVVYDFFTELCVRYDEVIDPIYVRAQVAKLIGRGST